MSHRTNFSALHNNVLMWGERHPKLYLEMQKNAGTKAEKEGEKKKKNQVAVPLSLKVT